MAEEPEYYRAQPLPPREGAPQGYRQGPPFGPAGGASQWGQPGAGAPTVNVNVVGGKSALLAYVLWFFLGQFGVHKFYLAQPFQGILYFLLGATGWLTVGILIGWFFLIPLWLLMLIDIFVIPLRVGTLNARLARRVSGY
ncbi:TM2 domain-containing protein [Kocuria tytonicola]|uniref:TM2 domain-containing protein n=1 Tax=Kocuria tytonicola TaxID=2055946 RepID=A0A3L9L5R1_9MICC|nr:TM2 domain-containing protein [Kocuria tytonicola]RLY93911.1 TM2 domain-containing protein [Kocuria tytonicola]